MTGWWLCEHTPQREAGPRGRRDRGGGRGRQWGQQAPRRLPGCLWSPYLLQCSCPKPTPSLSHPVHNSRSPAGRAISVQGPSGRCPAVAQAPPGRPQGAETLRRTECTAGRKLRVLHSSASIAGAGKSGVPRVRWEPCYSLAEPKHSRSFPLATAHLPLLKPVHQLEEDHLWG